MIRQYRFKNHARTFFCPLCGVERVQRVRARMSSLNHLQVALLTAFFCLFVGWQGLVSYFIFWMLFEGSQRLLFKGEVPCPHCGFDASWYKRDVRVARQKVQEFWSAQQKQKTH